MMAAGVASLVLTACITLHNRMEKDLDALTSIKDAVDVWGYPDAKHEMLGSMIYVWSTSHSAILPSLQTSTTTGSIGGTPIGAQTRSLEWIPVSADCTIQLVEGEGGSIKTWKWEGNEMGCDSYMRAIEKERQLREKAHQMAPAAG
jgi:hypothetical protein